MNLWQFISQPFIWLNEQLIFIKSFFIDAQTQKTSVTALMRFWVLVAFIGLYVKVGIASANLPNIPTEVVVIVLFILFQKQAGAIIDAYIKIKLGGGGK